MYFGDEIREIYTNNEKFFDFVLEDGMPQIIDYRYLVRDIDILKDNLVELGDIKKKKEINTIDEMRRILIELVLDVKQFFYRSYLDKIATHNKELSLSQTLNDYFFIKSEDMELLINQLIFDILLNKYIETEFKDEMKLTEYCGKHFYYDLDKKWVKSINNHNFSYDILIAKDTAYHMMNRQVKREIRVMGKQELEEAYTRIGIDPNEEISRFENKIKKPKIIWDYIFHAGNKKLITSRQYRRNFLLERNEDYEKLAHELNDYDKYIETVMMTEGNDNDKEYFRKSMDFYILEANNRLDFMYKLAEILESEGLSNSYKIRFLIDGLTVNVACPYIVQDEEDDVQLCFGRQLNRYLPILLIEKSCKRSLCDILKESDNNPFLDDYLIKIYRAKAYELFKYHYSFISKNYKDISCFIRDKFDILSFYEKNKMWKDIKGHLTPGQKTRLANIQIINNYLFPEFNGWNQADWRNIKKDKASSTTPPAKDKCDRIDETRVKTLKDEEFPLLIGMDKRTFEKILSILEDAYKKLHTPGGRPTRLSVLNKLLVTIEYSRNNLTMENIALNYGVSKSRISDTIKWVKKTLVENGTFSLAEILHNRFD